MQSRNTPPRDTVSAWRVIIGALLALPIAAGMYIILTCTILSYAAGAWTGLRATLGY